MNTTVYRPAVVSFRLSARQQRRLKRAARQQGKPLSEYLRDLIVAKLNGAAGQGRAA